VVVTVFLLGDLLFLGNWLELDHRHVAARLERVIVVEDVGDAARHAGREIASGAPKYHDDAARHVFAAVVPRAFDDGNGTRVADGEAFAGHAAEIALALDRAVQHRVADNDRFLGHDPGIGRRPDNEAPA